METNIEKFDARYARPVSTFFGRAARFITTFFDFKRRLRQWHHKRSLAKIAKLLHTHPPMPQPGVLLPNSITVNSVAALDMFNAYLERSPHGEEIRALFVVTGAAVQAVTYKNYVKFILDYPILDGRGDVFRRIIDDPITPDGWRARLAELAGDAEDAARKRGPLHRNGVLAERAAL